MKPFRVAVVGCGAICGIYFDNQAKFPFLDFVSCTDLDIAKAGAKQKLYPRAIARQPDEILHDPEIDAILNLTIPAAHAEVSLAALRAGKHVYSEKPLAITLEDGRAIVREAAERKLRAGCAPDTFLGGAHQTARRAIDAGLIGEPVAASAFMMSRGVETWHPNPEFYYQPGGGPMFDMGPYYLTALVNMLGPIRRISGSARASFPERLITSQPKAGKRIKVETPTHVAGTMEFDSGAIGTIITTFDVWASDLPRIEVYGSEGTLSVPDPNNFGGDVRIRKSRTDNWESVASEHGHNENSRGIGLADMALSVSEKRSARASAKLALHVLEAMHAFLESPKQGKHIELQSKPERPEPLPPEFP